MPAPTAGRAVRRLAGAVLVSATAVAPLLAPATVPGLAPGAASAVAGRVAGVAPASRTRCPAGTVTVPERVAAADVVLAGTVTGVTRSQTDRPRLAQATYTVEVDRVWQGSVAREVVEVTAPAQARACGVTLLSGRRYVVFAQADGSALSTDSRLGTAVATDALVADVEAELGEGRAVGVEPTEPEAPVATPVDDTPPPDFGRTAAPGAAIALVGLLGLLVLRRRSR